MGLSIHYKGRLKNVTELQSLIDEVKDVAITNQWDYFIFENEFKNNSFSNAIDLENLYGIMITAPKSEPLSFSFLPNGRMCGVLNFNVIQMRKSIDESLAYQLATKTQYAGIEIHKQIIHLLDYIAKKYLIDFECIDEGQYWETRDENLLKTTFEKYTHFIESFSSSIEMITKNQEEKTEDYILRIAETTKNKEIKNNDDEPKLSLEEEIAFKKMKIALEHDGVFSEKIDPNLPAEIENQFLDYVINFEEQFKNAKQISVYEKIGKPEFKLAEILNDEEIKIELNRIEALLHSKNIGLDVICDYENEERLIYKFITEELFSHEIDDISILEMNTHFIYEEFHPNNEYDIEHACLDFIKMFLNKKSSFYEDYHSKDALNHEALNNFRSLFKKFKIKFYEFGSIVIQDDYAKATFSIDFWAKISGTDKKVSYSGEGSMTFKHQYGYWYVQTVDLPINK